MKTITLATVGALILCGVAAPPVAAQNGSTSHRDSWQRVPAVLEAAGAVAGAHIADIGAGGGYFTGYLSDAVGEQGRVYAVDISRDAVVRLRGVLDRAGARNVDVILGTPEDPRLPYGSLDGAIIVNAYHEMTEYPAMLAAIRAALRPGGRLVILDHPARAGEDTRAEQTSHHRIAIGLVEEDLRDAGFDVVVADTGFIDERSDGHAHRMWLISARRPLKDPPPQRLSGSPAGPEGLFACPFRESAEELAERLSPPDSVEARVGGARVKVCYSRPSARGRTIMGDLVPFGEPWRTGANEATVLRTDRPMVVAGVRLEPGWYSLYTVPEADAWTLVLNALPDRNGMIMDEWVRSHDLGTVTLPVEDTGAPVEILSIRFEPAGATAAALIIEWERSRVRVPLRSASTP